MDNKYYKVNINDFNSNLLTISQVEETDKFNVKYNDKLMKIYSLSKYDSYGIKKVNNIYKISCIFKDDDYKNIKIVTLTQFKLFTVSVKSTYSIFHIWFLDDYL